MHELTTLFPGSRSWHTEPRGWWDVLRCRLGKHRRITQGAYRGLPVCRCSCGGIELERDGLWLDTNQVGRRRPKGAAPMDWREYLKRQVIALLYAVGLCAAALLLYAGLLLMLGRPLW